MDANDLMPDRQRIETSVDLGLDGVAAALHANGDEVTVHRMTRRANLDFDGDGGDTLQRCVWRTSLGRPVVPPVWKYAATSSGSMRRPLTNRSPGCRAARASHANTRGRSGAPGPTHATAVRSGSRRRTC